MRGVGWWNGEDWGEGGYGREIGKEWEGGIGKRWEGAEGKYRMFLFSTHNEEKKKLISPPTFVN